MVNFSDTVCAKGENDTFYVALFRNVSNQTVQIRFTYTEIYKKNRQDFLTKRMAADKKSAYQLLCPENKAYYADMQRDIDKIWVVVLVYYLRLVVSSCFCHSIIV